MSEPSVHPASRGFVVRQEEDAVESKAIVRVGIGGVLIAALAVVIGALVLFGADGALRPSLGGGAAPRPATRTIAGIEQTPILDAKHGLDVRARQQAELDRWGWADRDAGVAIVPIDRAIDLVVSGAAP